MRKFTGKAVSLVLAMALVVSSFSGTFAFAAKKTINAYDVDLGHDKDVVLVKDSQSSEYKFDVMEYIENIELKYVDGREKKSETITATSDDTKVTVRHASGDSLLAFKGDSENNDTPKIRVKKNETGKETVRIYAETTVDLEDGTEAKVKGSKDLTIGVASTDDRFVSYIKDNGENYFNDDPTKGDMDIPGDIEFTVDDDTAPAVDIYQAVPQDGNAYAHYEVATKDKDDNPIYIDGGDKGNGKVLVTPKPLTGYTDSKNATYQTVDTIKNLGKGHGTLKLNIKSLKEDGTHYKTNKTVDSTTVSILKKISIKDNCDVTKDGGKVKVPAEAIAGGYAASIAKDSNLSGFDFEGKDDNSVNINFKDNVSVGKVTHFSHVRVTDKAKTGDMDDIKDEVNIDDENSSIGVIDGIDGSVKMSEGRIASIDAGDVEINGGTVTGDIKAGDGKVVKINATDDDVNTAINGQVKATTVEIDADTDATVSINKIQLKDDGEITLNGENVTIKTLDADYEGDVKFEDFQGKIESLVQPDEITATEDTKAVIKGDVVATSLDIDEDGSIEFTGALTVDSVSGDGKLTVPADKFMINEDASSNLILKLSGNDVKVGDVAYKAKKDASVDTDSFKGFGYDVEKKNVDKNTDSYLVKNVQFAGVALDKTDIEIAKDYSNTVTVSNYPASAALPAGAKIVWDYSDADKDVFAVTENGNTVTIKVVGFDTSYATSNEFDLTATVVDANGDEIEDYDAATCKVTAVSEPKVSCDLSGIVEVPQGSIKNFTLSSPALVTPTLGNGAVAVTGTVKAYANGQATYAIKAIGAVGTTTGVYAHVGAFNKQVFTLKVVAPKVTCDTTMNFALAKGNRYVYKVTAPARPTFTVGNGAVIKTQYAKVVGNNYYFIVYAIGNAGQSTDRKSVV